jgi:hypothetical protein
MATARGIDPFLKAALPTRILKRHGQRLHRRAPGSSPYDTRARSHTSCKLTQNGRRKPPHAERVTAPRLQALLHPRRNQRSKGRTAMWVACNRTVEAHPFGFIASSMEAQAHTSCNRRAGYYVRETALPLAPMSRLLDCETSAATQGNPAHAQQCQSSTSITGQSAGGGGATVDMAKSGLAVMAAADERK